MNDTPFELDGPTATRQKMAARHLANKEVIEKSDIAMVFSRLVADLVPAGSKDPIDYVVALGSITELSTMFIATAATVLGVPAGKADEVTAATLDYVKAELPGMLAQQAAITPDLNEIVKGLDLNDPDVFNKIDERLKAKFNGPEA